MAKVKSPNYPRLSLGDVLAAARKAFDKDNRNKMSQAALAKHLGHDSLSGPALGKIGALRAYGVIEGHGDELRISENAVTAMMAPDGSAERMHAISALAAKPKLFQEIRADFPTPPSAENLKFWLVKRKFAGDAAETAAKSYLDTLRLVASAGSEYNFGEKEGEKVSLEMQTPSAEANALLDRPVSTIKRPMMLHEKFALDEGEVTLSYPAELSPESYQDMADRIEIVLRGLKRRAEAAAISARYQDPEYRAMREAGLDRRASQEGDDQLPPMGNMEKDARGVWKPKGQ